MAKQKIKLRNYVGVKPNTEFINKRIRPCIHTDSDLQDKYNNTFGETVIRCNGCKASKKEKCVFFNYAKRTYHKDNEFEVELP